MHDSSISTSKLITAALWAWVLLLFAAAWATWALGASEIWMMLAFTGCASSACAATSQIRCYALRLCAMVRATGGADRGELRSLR